MRALALIGVALWLGGCAFGRGDGELTGTLDIKDCPKKKGPYSMHPTFFGAEPVEQLLEIRVQHGSGPPEAEVDGIQVLVRDASDVQKNHLGQPFTIVDDSEAPVSVTLYLNHTCPPTRDRDPAVLPGVSGTIVFNSIYAPEGEDRDVQIEASLDSVRFVDPRDDARAAELSGYFRFLFQRGSPAQTFP